MRRRAFITLLGGAAATWPLAARAQQGDRMRRIGVLEGFAEGNREGQERAAAFREGLKQLGWVEGRNIRIDIRWAAPGDAELIRRLAKEVVALQPDLILSSSTPTTAALLNETRTIPVVFANISDPLGSGFVASYPHPGGNVVQPGNGGICRILAEPLQIRRGRLRRGGDRCTCSRRIRTRIRDCRTGARAERRPDRDAGFFPARPCCGGHIAGGPLSASRRLSIPHLCGARRPAGLRKRPSR